MGIKGSLVLSYNARNHSAKKCPKHFEVHKSCAENDPLLRCDEKKLKKNVHFFQVTVF